MKHKFLNPISITLFLIMILINPNLFSDVNAKSTIIVDIEGTGDYETIQEAINNTSDGDVVLVYPGTYYENVNFNGRNITLASRFYTTADESYIDSTIIDGNNNGSCVSIYSGEIDAEIIGFTIQNGSGTTFTFNYGGGLYIKKDTSTLYINISHCIIQNNKAQFGGGIYINGYSDLDIDGTTIKNNFAHTTGGGMHSGGYDAINFSQNDLCNIYNNYAPIGSDIYNNIDDMTVYLDTFTVEEPNKFYTYANNDEIIIQAQNHKIEPINQDLYVSPDGDNANSGLSSSDPLLNIYDALIKIKSDSTHPNTIQLDEGTYSPSGTGEFFALKGKEYISIIGAGMDKSILDAEQTFRLFIVEDVDFFNLKDMRLKNGYDKDTGGISIYYSSNSVISNVEFLNNLSYDQFSESHIHGSKYSNTVFENVILKNTYDEVDGKAIRFASYSSPLFLNCSVVKNKTAQEPGRNFGAMSLINNASPTLINCLIADNYGQITSGIANLWIGDPIYVINSTIVDNDDCSEGTISLVDDSHIHLINTILRNEPYTEIYFFPQHNPNSATLEYCNVDGGMAAIDVNNNGTLNWGEGNIDQDPLFVGGDPFSYQLSEDSPCIDAGTPDTTGLNLPATDLAGHPRIYNGRVDIGAYEYIPESVGGDPDTNFVNKLYLFQNKPNPFKNSTEILFITSDYERVENYTLSIYNTKGQLVRRYEGRANNFTVKTSIKWDGKDTFSREVAPGTYFYKLEYNNNAVVRKMVKIE